jgi:transcriptional regulator with XRE-family HTH domain
MDRDFSVLKDFGNRLRECRKERDLSQENLAFEAGLDRTFVSQTERGERNISLLNIVRLAHALKVPVAQLMEGVGQ